VPPGFGAGLVQVFKRRARQFELARRFQADGAVFAAQRDDIATLHDRFPAIVGERHQQIADAARLVIRGRAPVCPPIDELFMLGANALAASA
jgi:hypothetical protein